MSMRAIKKRDSKYYKNKLMPKDDNKNVENISNNQNIKSKSLPNLNDVNLSFSIVRKKFCSDTDIFKLQNLEKKNLISTKSEVCLKTISVHNTLHVDMPKGMKHTKNVSRINKLQISSLRRNSEIFSTYSQTPSEYETRGFADNSCVRIPIIGYEVIEERARFTVYKLRVENPFTNNCWLVLRRYTDFVRFNNKLKQQFSSLNLQLPRKKLFGDNFNSVFLDNRIRGLQMFVNSIMANDQLRMSKSVREFFCLDEPPSYSESMEECRAIFEAQEETIAHLKYQLKHKDDLILSLKQKLAGEVAENERLRNIVRQTSLKCKDVHQ